MTNPYKLIEQLAKDGIRMEEDIDLKYGVNFIIPKSHIILSYTKDQKTGKLHFYCIVKKDEHGKPLVYSSDNQYEPEYDQYEKLIVLKTTKFYL